MKSLRSTRSFGGGVLVGLFFGLVLGSSGLAIASLSGKGWHRFSDEFRIGYVTGFIDMVSLARNIQPEGFIDTRYPLWPKVRPLEWKLIVDELYRNPENEKYSAYSIMQLAATELKKKHGAAPSTIERIKPQLEGFIKAAEQRKLAAIEKAKAEGKPIPEVSKPPKTATAKAPAEPGSGRKSDPWPKRKKRCPCPEEPKAGEAGEAKPATVEDAPR